MLGGLLALVAAVRTPAEGLNMPYFPIIQVAPATIALGVAAGVLVGVLAGLSPARRAARGSVTAALRDEG